MNLYPTSFQSHKETQLPLWQSQTAAGRRWGYAENVIRLCRGSTLRYETENLPGATRFWAGGAINCRHTDSSGLFNWGKLQVQNLRPEGKFKQMRNRWIYSVSSVNERSGCHLVDVAPVNCLSTTNLDESWVMWLCEKRNKLYTDPLVPFVLYAVIDFASSILDNRSPHCSKHSVKLDISAYWVFLVVNRGFCSLPKAWEHCSLYWLLYLLNLWLVVNQIVYWQVYITEHIIFYFLKVFWSVFLFFFNYVIVYFYCSAVKIHKSDLILIC